MQRMRTLAAVGGLAEVAECDAFRRTLRRRGPLDPFVILRCIDIRFRFRAIQMDGLSGTLHLGAGGQEVSGIARPYEQRQCTSKFDSLQ